MGPIEDSMGSTLPFSVSGGSDGVTGDEGVISSSSSSAKVFEGGGLDDMINEKEIVGNE